MSQAETAPTPDVTLPPPVKFIPGLNYVAPATSKKTRSRPKNTKAASATDGQATATAEPTAATAGKGAGLKLAPEALSVVEPLAEQPKRTPASVIVGKRYKAIQKKLVRRFLGPFHLA
jgi:hypothetical protein